MKKTCPLLSFSALFLMGTSAIAQEHTVPFEILEQFNQAVKEDALDTVKKMVEENPALVHTPFADAVPLLYAARHGSFKTVQYLLQKGANPNGITREGLSMLMLAAQGKEKITVFTNRYLETVKALANDSRTNLGAQDPYGDTALMHAIRAENKDIALYLIQKSDIATLNIQNGPGKNNYSALMLAVEQQSQYDTFPIMKALIDKGVNVNARNQAGETALFIASGFDKLKPFEYLIKTGHADVNLADNNGVTPLMILGTEQRKLGVFSDYPKMIRLIISHKADVAKTDKNGRTALVYPILYNKDKKPLAVLKELLDGGAKNYIDQQDPLGSTALMHAASVNKPAVVETLIRSGANVNAVNKKHDTALTIAQHNNLVMEYLRTSKEIQKYLQSIRK
jgi:ankyrin repeat protein